MFNFVGGIFVGFMEVKFDVEFVGSINMFERKEKGFLVSGGII